MINFLPVWRLNGKITTPAWVVYLPTISYFVYIVTIFARIILIFVEDFK